MLESFFILNFFVYLVYMDTTLQMSENESISFSENFEIEKGSLYALIYFSADHVQHFFHRNYQLE